MKFLFWKRRIDAEHLGFRVQLQSLTQDLRRQLSDIPDEIARQTALEEIETIETQYLGDLRTLWRKMS